MKMSVSLYALLDKETLKRLIYNIIAKIFDLLIAQIENANKPPTEEKGGCTIS